MQQNTRADSAREPQKLLFYLPRPLRLIVYQRCSIFGDVLTFAIFNKVISAGTRYRLSRVYVPPRFVCGRYSFECPRLLPQPFLPRAGGDLFYYLQLVSAATSYTQRRSATCARVSAKNTAQFTVI